MNDNTLQSMAQKYGTPLYAYDGDKIISQFNTLKSCYPKEIEIFYSMKTNPLLGICQLFKKLNSYIEAASVGELYTALEAGFHPEQIVFTSPGKSCDELEYAIDKQIYSINIESIDEAVLINRIASEKNKRVDISIRVNPDFDATCSSIKMSGVPTQFGIDQALLGKAFETFSQLPCINVIGIHVYTGTQALHAEKIIFAMEQIIILGLELSDTYGFPLRFLDMGGGFGIPYFKGENELNTDSLREGAALVWDKYRERLSKTRVAVESGRFLMAEAGRYLVKALYIKECKGNKYIVCDGGSNQHASSAFLGRHIRSNFPMHVLNKTEAEEEVNVVGPLCTPTDVVGQRVKLPAVNTGDIIAVDKSGAYGLTQSPLAFLSHPSPAEVIQFGDEAFLLRERGKKEDLIKGQKQLPGKYI
ncbi:diaminopimelate decarboxylase [Ruminiclostridium sufflavum DSM 19573]|uniref:Diaminopimelate decarboxylase n=1 Tax=Ruminiclostridium sufflavum DSM 19573 TaxID=1121337 RepID=A0A318XW06_9FIRM|nr:type III PLP-dependent enzyme [Ruminiclostridium sufflavum]PYG86987.1 diaminopimelate decarboxylase [Ruminiclostridium sufflavum DSM 19573]